MLHYIITFYVAPHITLYNGYLYNKRCNFDFFIVFCRKINISDLTGVNYDVTIGFSVFFSISAL